MEPNVVHSTFVIEHHYPYPPERLFAAFSDPARKRRWYAEGDTHDVEQFEMDFRIGGAENALYRMRPGTPFPGVALRNEGVIQDIIPNQRVVTATTMSLGDHRISSSLITVEFLPNTQGTDLVFTHQGAFYEGSGGPKMREDGWRRILDRLAAVLSK
ncbi:MAG TPA: SRPBCC family protein [Acidobacteriaceae bacterium]|nr:SRPBCC family protein [Acidobacteriaceae bacterium]